MRAGSHGNSVFHGDPIGEWDARDALSTIKRIKSFHLNAGRGFDIPAINSNMVRLTFFAVPLIMTADRTRIARCI